MDSLKKILGSIGKFILYILEFIIIIYVVVITTFLLCRNKYGYTEVGSTTLVPLKIDTAEYIKDGKEGNLLVVKKTSNLKEGDLIYYYTSEDERYVVKSDYIKSIFNGDGNKLYTLDDGVGSTVVSTRVLGKYANQYAGFGTIFALLTSKFGFLFLVLLPIMCIFIYQLYSLIMVLKYEKVELSELDKELNETEEKEKKKEETKKVETKEEEKKEEPEKVETKVEEKKEEPEKVETKVEEKKEEPEKVETKEEEKKEEPEKIESKLEEKKEEPEKIESKLEEKKEDLTPEEDIEIL